MKHVVYFTDQAVVFSTDQSDVVDANTYILEHNEGFLRSKVHHLLENHNSLLIISCDPDRTFSSFVAEYAYVEAAGGVVRNPRGEWLMMERRGRWDFPKGHVEMGESYPQTAVREIEEETGVRGEIEGELCQTWHAYYFERNARWEIKRTYWYVLKTLGEEALVPQTEEDITHVVWCNQEQVSDHLQHTFPTIVEVAKALLQR